jgi:hypothetical protein
MQEVKRKNQRAEDKKIIHPFDRSFLVYLTTVLIYKITESNDSMTAA